MRKVHAGPARCLSRALDSKRNAQIMPPPIPIPEHQARMYTRIAAGFAVLSAVMTGAAMRTGMFGANYFALIDIAILLGLAYGVLRGNMASAVILFVYHVANRVYLYQVAGVKPGQSAFMYGAMYLLGALGAAALPPRIKPLQSKSATIGGEQSE